MMNSHAPGRPAPVWLFIATFTAGLAASASAAASQPFTVFESGQARPLSMSPNGKLLFAVNTPDNRLEVFDVTGEGLAHRGSVPVGLEPVAVAARSNNEVWVVNNLSDSVSIVKLDHGAHGGHVVRTLLVGDEPGDIVFAGHGRRRAFITTAHRGQNIGFDPQFTTPGVGRADVWVFDANHLGQSLGGDPLTIVTLFADTPRALAVTPDGSRVYAAGFHSGNQTTTVAEFAVPNGFEAAGGLPNPSTNFQGVPAPETGLIVKYNGTHWVDELGRTWDHKVKFNLPDKDVFVIDAIANPPAQLPGSSGFFAGVGTVIFNMTVNPVSGNVYVANTDARNEVRFEGPGIFAGSSVRGHLHESRITVLSPGGPGAVTPRHLNKHIDYSACCAPVPNLENETSLAFPQGMAVTSDGATLYVAALGSGKIGVYNTAELENDTFTPSAGDHITLSGGGPTGLVLDEDRERLYVLTRFDNSISIVGTDTESEIAHISMHNPEPASVVNGRRFLYDATFTSSHGDSACASCHIFGDLDGLPWDLGNPDLPVLNNPGPFAGPLINVINGQAVDPDFHPMKGPMMTQSLRGMANHGPMHWRGDRTAGNDEPSAQPDSGTFDEEAAFKKFQVGFVDLLGRSEPIPEEDMQAFTDFILQVTYPPNPNRNLDNSLTADQQAGLDFLSGTPSDFAGPCFACHTLDLEGNAGSTAAPGFFGSSGKYSFEFLPQVFKAAHFRSMYTKIGMFGLPEVFLFPGGPPVFGGSFDHQGDQVRGSGFTHDGAIDTIFRFMTGVTFDDNFVGNTDGFPPGSAGDPLRRQAESFILVFPSNMAPIVGQQVTLTESNGGVAGPRIDLLRSRAEAGECDLVAKTYLGHDELGFFYIGSGEFIGDRQALPVIPDALLRQYSDAGGEITYTCTPPGSGERIGIDRDGDGHLDGDETDAGSDPGDASSVP